MPASPPASRDPALDRLDALVGEWRVEILHPDYPAEERTSFEWMPGRMFLVQRWSVDDPFPDGIAVIGMAESSSGFCQHYFDERGVNREWQMDLVDDTWTLYRERTGPDDFSQRFTGTFSIDHLTITGRCERADDGKTWQLDFDMIYRKVS